jgi:hypothetical protein
MGFECNTFTEVIEIGSKKWLCKITINFGRSNIGLPLCEIDLITPNKVNIILNPNDLYVLNGMSEGGMFSNSNIREYIIKYILPYETFKLL